MIAALGFWVFLLSATAIFVIAGRMTERVFILVILTGTIGTLFASGTQGAGELPWLTFLIDLALWFCGLFLVLTTDRYWAIWFTGFHSNAVLLHIASFFTDDHFGRLFNYAAAFWAIPALGIASYGVLLDYRSRRRSRLD